MATNMWILSGNLKTYAATNTREALSTSPLTAQGDYNEMVVQQGVLVAGGGWVDVDLGAIDTANMLEVRLSEPLTIRLNGTFEVDNCERLILLGGITQLEIHQHATHTPTYWAQFFGI